MSDKGHSGQKGRLTSQARQQNDTKFCHEQWTYVLQKYIYQILIFILLDHRITETTENKNNT